MDLETLLAELSAELESGSMRETAFDDIRASHAAFAAGLDENHSAERTSYDEKVAILQQRVDDLIAANGRLARVAPTEPPAGSPDEGINDDEVAEVKRSDLFETDEDED